MTSGGILTMAIKKQLKTGSKFVHGKQRARQKRARRAQRARKG
jgi:hypothetical protein